MDAEEPEKPRLRRCQTCDHSELAHLSSISYGETGYRVTSEGRCRVDECDCSNYVQGRFIDEETDEPA
jgi:hypothetical protein